MASERNEVVVAVKYVHERVGRLLTRAVPFIGFGLYDGPHF